MSYEINNAVINNVLCFIYTGRNTLSSEEIVSSAVAFYTSEKIKEAKETIFRLYKEKLISRKSCEKYPNPSVPNMMDILKLLAAREGDHQNIPTFLCDSFDAMPPRGFSSIAGLICDLRDELASLRIEIQEHRKERISDIKALEDISDVKEDVNDTKKAVVGIKDNLGKIMAVVSPNSVLDTSGDPPIRLDQSLPTFSQIVKRGVPLRNKAPTLTMSTGPTRISNRRGVFGTKKPSPAAKVVGVVRKFDLFVGKCSPNTTCLNIVEYCQEGGIKIEGCEKLNSRSTSTNSFKITTTAHERDKLLDPDFWPEDVIIRKFYNPKKTENQRQSSSVSEN